MQFCFFLHILVRITSSKRFFRNVESGKYPAVIRALVFLFFSGCPLLNHTRLKDYLISGRDDRAVADHGKELRMPYLDEEVVAFLDSVPPWYKTNPLQSRDTGDKYLLREVAKVLSLSEVSMFAKRAIQFGSRIAKLENKKEKASDNCSRLID